MDTQPPSSKFPWGAIIGVGVLALAGIAMLVYAIYSLFGGSPAAAPATPVAVVPTVVFTIPTTTPVPTVPAVISPTETPAAALPTATSTAEGGLKINKPANVRSGPGTNYPALGGLQPGDTAVVIGRDATAQWYVINYSSAASGQGWVSNTVSTYDGDVNSLPVIAAPPPPAPTNTPVPTKTPIAAATSTPAGYVVNGIKGDYFTIKNTTVAAGQDIWFTFQVTNITDGSVNFGLVAAHTDVGFTAKSYSGPLDAHKSIGPWEDHLNINTPGTYQVYLGICLASNSDCVNGSPPWSRLSGNITVVVQ
jgi:uncharacterized protein YraI